MKIPKRSVTYIVLSVYLLTLINRKQHKYLIEIELDFAEYRPIHYTDVRMVDLCWALNIPHLITHTCDCWPCLY